MTDYVIINYLKAQSVLHFGTPFVRTWYSRCGLFIKVKTKGNLFSLTEVYFNFMFEATTSHSCRIFGFLYWVSRFALRIKNSNVDCKYALGTPLKVEVLENSRRSFIKIYKMISDKTEPCGTPVLKMRVELKDFSSPTVCFLFERKHAVQVFSLTF